MLGAGEVALGLVAGALLVARELPRPAPLVPFDLLRIRAFGMAVATSIASFVAQMLAFSEGVLLAERGGIARELAVDVMALVLRVAQ